MGYKYNGGGRWDKTYGNTDNPRRNQIQPKSPPTIPAPSELDKVDKDNNSSSSSSKKAKKEVAQREFNILTGDVKVDPVADVRAKRTVYLSGIGSQLTGLYYVEKMSVTYSASGGVSRSISVKRNGFEDSIKKGLIQKPTPKNKKEERKPTVDLKKEERKHTVTKGETLVSIAKKYKITWVQLYNHNKMLLRDLEVREGQVLDIPYQK